MRIFFDTEFIDDGKTIELLSIGMVREDGEIYYAVVADADWERAKAHPWLAQNVIPHLPNKDGGIPYRTRKQIASDVIEFAGKDPEFWADYGSYDWVALCQLYGTMMGLPSHFPMFVRDIQQFKPKGMKFAEMDGTAHNALDDALDCKSRYEQCTREATK